MKKYIFIAILSLVMTQAKSQDTITTQPFSGSFCISNLTIQYTVVGTYFVSTRFIAQLSDSAGSFANPVSIGSFLTPSTGTYYSGLMGVAIPRTTKTSHHYRIRVTRNTSGDSVKDNGSDLTIYSTPPAPTLSVNGSPCVGNILVASGAVDAAEINWYNWSVPAYGNPGYAYNSCVGGYQYDSIVAGGGYGTFANELTNPTDVVVDRNGYIYVSDLSNNRIQRFPPGSSLGTNAVTVAGGNGAGSATNQITPNALCIDNSGNIYVADAVNNRVLKFPSGSSSATYGTIVAGGNGQGSAANQLNAVSDVCLDRAGNLYVVDQSNNRIQMFPPGSSSSTNGITVAGGNGAGGAANQLNSPLFVRLDSAGNLYVADNYQRIQKFPAGSTSSTNAVTISGTYNQQVQNDGSITNTFYSITGMALDRAGNIFVVDGHNNHVVKLQAGGGNINNGIIVAGAGLSANNLLNGPLGIFIDSIGNQYIVNNGYVNNYTAMIEKWSPATPDSTLIPSYPGGYYSVAYNNSAGCMSAFSDTLFIGFNFTPQVFISGKTNICSGSSDTFKVAQVGGGGTNPVYEWYKNGISTGISDSIYIPNNLSNQDSIWVLMTSNHACAYPATVKSSDSVVTVKPAPYAHFTLQPSNTPHLWYALNQCSGTSLTYSWDWGDNSPVSTGDTPSHTYDSAGYYTICVTVANSQGCSDSYCDTSIYLFKDQSNQLVYVNVLQSLPLGISTMNADNMPDINYYAGAIHFSKAINIPTDMTLYDMSGRQIMSKNKFTGASITIDKNISQGVYLITLQNDDYTLSRKLAILQ